MSARGFRWAPVVLAYAAFILVGVSAAVTGVLLPTQMRDYDVTEATIGISFFVFSAGFLIAGVTSGPLIHRFGVRTALLIGGGAYVLAALYLATHPPFPAFLAVQLLAGYGGGLTESVLNAYLAELPSAATLLNRLHAFFGVGALLGPLLAAWMLEFTQWPIVWLVLGLAGVLMMAGFAAAYPGRRAQEAAAVPRPKETAEPAGGGLLATALRSPVVVLGSVFLTVYVGLEVSVGNWGFRLLVEEHGLASLTAGYVASGYWLGLTLGRFLISPVATRLGLTAIRMTYVCLVGVMAGCLLSWLAPVGAVAGAGFLLLGFFLGPLFPTAMAVVPELTESRLVPTAIGVMNGMSVIGGALLPWLAGVIAQGAGVGTLMPYALALGLLQLVLWWLLAGRTAPARRPAEAVADGPARS